MNEYKFRQALRQSQKTKEHQPWTKENQFIRFQEERTIRHGKYRIAYCKNLNQQLCLNKKVRHLEFSLTMC